MGSQNSTICRSVHSKWQYELKTDQQTFPHFYLHVEILKCVYTAQFYLWVLNKMTKIGMLAWKNVFSWSFQNNSFHHADYFKTTDTKF